MVNYVEEYKVFESRLGIEDQEAEGQHFFSHDYKSGKRKRFACWAGGSGIGQADTLEEARGIIGKYLGRKINQKLLMINSEIELISGAQSLYVEKFSGR